MKRILVVEDDQKIAMALMIRLKANGYDASVAPDALAGASKARAIKPDLILLDISMPGGNGLQLAETFQRIPETTGTPIIFITASKSPGLLQKVMELGAIGLFEKPFDTDKLLSAIDSKFNRTADLLDARQRSATGKAPER
jgi:twitching motility two-component system response regulator PilH